MKQIAIKNYATGEIVTAGAFDTIKDCAERAVTMGMDLSHADLRGANLAHAELDGALLRGAWLDSANLTGANLSESDVRGGRFRNCAMQAACLCQSDLTGADFTGAMLDGMDIAGSVLSHCRFSTWSALRLNFRDALSLLNCVYLNEVSGQVCGFSRPPVYIAGLDAPVALFDAHMQWDGGALSGMDAAGLARLQAALRERFDTEKYKLAA